MRCSPIFKTLAFLIAISLSISSFAFAQQRPRDETRPRRTQDQKQTSEPNNGQGEWKQKIDTTIAETARTLRLEQEPTMRIGLDRKSTRLNSSHSAKSRMPSSA